jgi:3,4-dihydroxy 2-butanone 4-phosphate synthase/GTP cyclohydrolase II
VGSVRLLTNNPLKISSLRSLGVPVSARISLPSRITGENAEYLSAKAQRMNHLLELAPLHDMLTHRGNNGTD